MYNESIKLSNLWVCNKKHLEEPWSAMFMEIHYTGFTSGRWFLIWWHFTYAIKFSNTSINTIMCSKAIWIFRPLRMQHNNVHKKYNQLVYLWRIHFTDYTTESWLLCWVIPLLCYKYLNSISQIQLGLVNQFAFSNILDATAIISNDHQLFFMQS